MSTWHLIVEPAPLPGSWNMAVDEHLYRLAERSPRTFLRFYQWERPTASLGYSQEADKVVDTAFCAAHGIDIVRRMTGGKLVLHHREVTYSVASSDAAVFTETLRESYRLISRALLGGLAILGVAARLAETSPPAYIKGTMPCFAFPARDEIEIGGRKIVGSAQKRTGDVFLQHGSIPLEKDEALLAAVSAPGETAESQGMTSLSEALGPPRRLRRRRRPPRPGLRRPLRGLVRALRPVARRPRGRPRPPGLKVRLGRLDLPAGVPAR
ncbi:MAG: lipoate--protein ligase family protein [Candidatus Moduliflexus flocculans]|nr:lipoate--protein ligase family protein [Candidatus Moduliflexus flocculans]